MGRNGGNRPRHRPGTPGSLQQRLLLKHVSSIAGELAPLPVDGEEAAQAVCDVLLMRHQDKYHGPRDRILSQVAQGAYSIVFVCFANLLVSLGDSGALRGCENAKFG